MIELLKFSHDRDADFKQSCDALRDIIDAFVEQPDLDDWYNHFEKGYSLPSDVIKQQMKAYLSHNYDYRKGIFFKKFFQKERFKSVAKHMVFLSYLLYFSKYYPETVNTYDLIVPCDSERDFNRLSKLIDLFGKGNVLIFTKNNINKSGYRVLYRPRYKLYDRKEVTLTVINEIKNGLRLYLDLSKKIGLNLLPIASNIINQYLSYYSIFKYNISKYYIEQKTYETSAVRNFVFRRFGGAYSCCTQINIIPIGANGFYYDMDVFFAFGNKTAERAFEYGSRINHVVPVGSTAMEYYYFNNKVNNTHKQKFDIIYVNTNAYRAFHYLDAYSSFIEDYYDTYRWLADFSKRNPHLRIGILRHSDSETDETEFKIINDTPIEYIEQKLNSYEVALQSKCVVSHGSTMGYELLGHGVPVLYLDPGKRNLFLPDKDDSLLGPYRVTDYKDFCQKLEILLSGQSLVEAENLDNADFCLKSDKVSERIYSWLLSEENKASGQ